MDPSFDSEDGGQPCENPDSIELGNHAPWLEFNLNDWQLEEDVRDQLRENDVSVQHWLQKQGNSQPSQGTFLSSQSLYRRNRETSNVLVHVENVFGGSSRPSSVQATPSFDPTALRPRKPTTSNVVTSIDERLQQKSRPTAPSFKPSSTISDRKITYSENANNDEGRPLETLTSQNQSTISTTVFGPPIRGSYKQSVGPLHQQTACSVAGTDISSSSKKPPKRQNSRSIDDDPSSKHVISKRNRSGINGQSWRRPSPASSGSLQAASLQPAVGVASTPQRRGNVFSSTSTDSSSSSVTRDGTTHIHTRKLVSHEDFVDRCETCPFWLHTPEQFSSTERHACSGRKEEVSHIITHVSDHHGLIRGRDPKNQSRKYLTSCHTHNPLIKAKGNCAKCSSLHNWKDEDFSDSEHQGVTLCLRCWCRFDKRSMQAHMAAPMCTYNSEQLKQKKVCVLYTTFCSETKSPGGPPRNMAPRRSNPRPASTRSDGSHARQQANNQPARRPNPAQASQDLRLTSSQLSYGQRKHNPSPALSSPGPTQNRPVPKRQLARSPQHSRIHDQQAVTGGQPIWQQSNTYQPSHQPIAYVPIYPDTSLENIAGMVETMQRNGYREGPQSFRPETKRSANFGNMSVNGNSPDGGFQQPRETQAQSLSLHPSQYHSRKRLPSHSQQTLQRNSRAFSHGRQHDQRYGNVPLAHGVQHGMAPPASFQQSPNQFLGDNKIPTIEAQPQLPMQTTTANANSATYNETDRLIFQACYDAVTMPQLQPEPQHQTVSMSDLDATLSLSGALSQVQSSPSRVASTAGESMGLLNSPDAEEPQWLITDWYAEDEEVSWLKSVGSHPVLQEEEPAGGSRPPPRMDHFGDLKADGRTPAMQQTSMEKDSAYCSMDYDDADFANRMFT
ncbi:hypothetical protein FGRMN_5438 [Fusarium graminum]|nr:hypothetical protein FGRMN_5438 [Fusarium graminum]